MNNSAQTIGFKTGERNVFLHILTACNLSCRHCYINKEQHGNHALTRQQMLDWIKLFADPVKRTNLIFLGGEPTLHKDLALGVLTAKKLGYNVTVDTNGYLFNDILGQCSPDLIDFLSFSIDGSNSNVNDPIRGEGVFDICTANLKKSVKLGYNVSVIYTVSQKNLADLEKMVPLLLQFGVKKFFIQVIGLRGNSAKADSAERSQVTREQWLSIVPQVAVKAAQEGIQVIYPKVFLEDHEKFECAGNVAENYFVFPNGRVYQCPLCEDYPINSYQIENTNLQKVGGLREDNFFKLEIAEGCVMNKLLQPDTIEYTSNGDPVYKISCCLLKQEIG